MIAEHNNNNSNNRNVPKFMDDTSLTKSNSVTGGYMYYLNSLQDCLNSEKGSMYLELYMKQQFCVELILFLRVKCLYLLFAFVCAFVHLCICAFVVCVCVCVYLCISNSNTSMLFFLFRAM